MTIRRSLAAQGGLLAATLIFSLVVGSRLPDTVVTHWDLSGQPDGWGSKWIALLLMPGVVAFNAVLTLVLPAVSPREARIERFGRVYGWIMFLVGAMMAVIHVVIVLKTAGAAFDIGRALVTVMFAVWILLGNVIGKVGRNYFMGIRTPWTLASDRVWHATHRAAGRLWVFGGAAGLLLALLGAPPFPLILGFVALALVPVAQSYFIYRRLEG